MKRFTKTMAALGLAAVMGTGSAFIMKETVLMDHAWS